jgi:xanthine dehydrogenase YagT iron-sulfur-binding subunit
MDKRNDDQDGSTKGFTRRGFLLTMGTGAMAAAATTALPHARASEKKGVGPGEMVSLTLSVNGHRHRLLAEPRWSLLFVLRERLGLTGAKIGCERGECGACTVLVDGEPRYACMTLALEAEGTEVTTVEGLMEGEALGPVQEAFLENDAFQCGYCTPGQVTAAEGLLRGNADPTPEEIRVGMSGNLCRCGAYANIFKAVKQAAGKR